MKKASIIILCMVMIGVGISRPTVTAGNGLFRVQDASTMGQGALGFNLHIAGDQVGMYHLNDADPSTWDAVVRIGASWAPLDYLEIGLVPALGYFKTVDTDAEIGLWDMEINAKGSYSNIPVLKLGAQLRTILPIGAEAFFPADYNNGLDIGGRALITADLGDVMSFPLRFHLNGGYMMVGDDIGGSDVSDYLPIGFGFEIPTDYVTFFTEVYTEQLLDSDLTSDIFLGPALRFSLPFGLNVDFGAEFLILAGEDDPREDWYRLFTMGVSWSTPEEKHIPMGGIAGTVKDVTTNQSIMARVTFPGTEIGPMNATSMGFKADSLTPGIYTVEVMAEGYESEKKTVTVVDGQMAQLSFNLKPIMVSLSGAVHDRKTDAGIPARIRFVDGQMGDIETDPATGLYKTMLEPGTYGLEVTSEGYLPQTASVNVGKNGTVKDFNLVKKGMKISFQGINFETAKATILPESYPILDEAAKVLKENPTIRVEIGGHTDSQGSASSNMTLSQKRAESVRLYLIENHEIEGNRLLAKGYGESQPIAANDTKENMAKNRRVEFTILEQ